MQTGPWEQTIFKIYEIFLKMWKILEVSIHKITSEAILLKINTKLL
jgi:hypothetical protein